MWLALCRGNADRMMGAWFVRYSSPNDPFKPLFIILYLLVDDT